MAKNTWIGRVSAPISHLVIKPIRFYARAFPIVTTKRLPFRWVAEELFWFLSGDTNEANLRSREWTSGLNGADDEHTRRFGREAGDLGPVYGYLWRSFGGAYPARTRYGPDCQSSSTRFKQTPDSRRLIVTGWGPATGRQGRSATVPYAVSIKVENRKHPSLSALPKVGGCFSRRAVQH